MIPSGPQRQARVLQFAVSSFSLCNIATSWYTFTTCSQNQHQKLLLPAKTWVHVCFFRSILRAWSWGFMQMWGKTPVLDTLAVWATMRPTLRLLLTGVSICSSLMAAIWSGPWREKVSSNFWRIIYSFVTTSTSMTRSFTAKCVFVGVVGHS